MRTPGHKQWCLPCANTQLPTPRAPVEQDRKVRQPEEPPPSVCPWGWPWNPGMGCPEGLSLCRRWFGTSCEAAELSRLHTPPASAARKETLCLAVFTPPPITPGTSPSSSASKVLGSRAGVLPARLRGVKCSSVVRQPPAAAGTQPGQEASPKLSALSKP